MGVSPGERHLERYFPGLRNSPYAITSPPDHGYNCVAWAVGISHQSWDALNPSDYWPAGLPRRNAISAVMAALATAGFAPCADGALEAGAEKVALYGIEDAFRHAARQLPNGRWTSKLGISYDIEHELQALTSSANAGGGVQYGEVAAFMRRAREG